MYKIVFVFAIGIATGYFVAGFSDSGIAPRPTDRETEPNAVTEHSVVKEVNTEPDVDMKSFIDESIGLRLMYRAEPNGYVVRAHPKSAEVEASFLKGYQFMLRTSAEAYVNGASEGPATIDVRVYKNTDRLAPSVWASANPALSNISLARSDLEEAVVGGANATRYLVDGLYLTETVVVAHANMIYVITGAYISEDDATYIDFEPFLESVEFIPVS